MSRIAHKNPPFTVKTYKENYGRKLEEANFLGKEWEKIERNYPSLNKLMYKIIEGQNKFLDRHSKLPADSEWLKIAKRNHTLAWTKIFFKVDFDKEKREKRLNSSQIKSPKYPPTRILLWVYAMSSYLYWDMKESTLSGSSDRLYTLGPFRYVFSEILHGA